jgi:hypothetical protein
LLARFADPAGGFFFTSHDHEPLLQRPKPGFDNATPSGNAMGALVLQRLGHLLGETRYLEAAEATLGAFGDGLRRRPQGFATMLAALAEHVSPPTIVVLRGPAHALEPWATALARAHHPDLLALAIPEGIAGLPPMLDKPAPTGKVNAFVCRGVTCSPPVAMLAELESLIALRPNPVA